MVNQEKSLGRIFLDKSGITERLFGVENVAINVDIPNKNFEEVEELREKIRQCNTTVEIDVEIDKAGLAEVEGLSQHIKELHAKGEIDKLTDKDVNKFIQTQNYKNIANNAHGYTGVNKAIKEYNRLLNENTDSAKKFLDTIRLTNSSLADAMTKYNTGSMTIGDYGKSLAVATAKTVGLTAATTALNAVVSFGISAVITGIITLITHAITKEEELMKKAKEIGQSFNDTSDDIDSYKKKIEELKEVINDSTSSYEQVTNARRDLLKIQDELIGKYGFEVEGINAITDAINDEAEALDRLKEIEWENSKTEYNKTDWKDDAVSSVKTIFSQPLTDPLGLVTLVSTIGQSLGVIKEPLEGAQEQVANLEKTLDDWNHQEINIPDSGNKKVDKLMDKLLTKGTTDWLGGDFKEGYDGYGSIPELKEKLEQIKAYANSQENVDQSFLDNLNNVLDELKSVYASNYKLVNDSILYDKIKPNDSYNDSLTDLEELKSKYDDALLTADEEKINKSAQDFVNALNVAIKLAIQNGDDDVARYFEDKFPTMKNISKKMNFKDSLSSDSSLEEATNSLKDYNEDDILSFLSTKNKEKDEEAFENIRDKAIEDGVILNDSIEETKKLIDLLVEWGNLKKSVQNSKPSSSATLFPKAWKSTAKDTKEALLELASAGELTPETICSTEKYKTLLEQTGLSAEKVAEKINKMVTSSEQLNSMGNGIKPLSENLVTKKENPKQAISYDTLSGMSDELKEHAKEWKEYERVMGDANSSYEDCEEVTNKLATAFVKSGNFLANLRESNKDYYISQLEIMGVDNAEIIVKDALNKKTKALALAEKMEQEEGIKYINSTWDKIVKTDAYKNASNSARIALEQLYLKENIFNNNKLSVQEKIDKLKEYVATIGQAGLAIAANEYAMKKMYEDGSYANGFAASKSYGKYWLEYMNDNLMPILNSVNDDVKITPPSTSKQSSPSNSTDKKKSKETKQEINWLERRLTQMQKLLDVTASKLKNLFSVDDKNNNLNKQINQLKKLIKQYGKAVNIYNEQAKKVGKGLSDSIKKKVVSGEYSNANKSKWFKKYSQKKAEEISKYIDLIDKANEAKISRQNAIEEKRQKQIEKYQNRADSHEANIALLEQQSENADDYKTKNKYIDQQIKKTKSMYKHLKAIAEINEDSVELSRLEEEQRKKISEYAKEQFDNMTTYYENQITEIENYVTSLNNKIMLAQTQGKHITASYYTDLIAKTPQKKEELNQELELMKKFLEDNKNEIIKGSSEWYEMLENINSCSKAIEECDIQAEEYNKTLRDMAFNDFSDMLRNLQNINEESQFIISLLSKESSLFEKYSNSRDKIKPLGIFNEKGLAVLSLHANSISNYTEQAKKNQDAIEELDNSYANHNIELDEYIERKNTLTQSFRDATLAIYNERDSIKSLIEEAYTSQIEALKDLTEAKKESLDAEKELYEYQENVEKQTKNIVSLKKQISALQGDNSEEAKARIQKLQVELNDAEKNLKETEYDKYLSDQESLLDDIMSEFETFTENNLNDIENLIDQVIYAVNDDSIAKKAVEEINKTAIENGFTISSNLSSLLDSLSLEGDLGILAEQENSYLSAIETSLDKLVNHFCGNTSDVEINGYNPVILETMKDYDIATWIKEHLTTENLSNSSLSNYLQQLTNGMGLNNSDISALGDMLGLGSGFATEQVIGEIINRGIQEWLKYSVNKDTEKLLETVNEIKEFVTKNMKYPSTKADDYRYSGNPLSEYFSKLNSGKTLTVDSQKQLANMLGIKVTDWKDSNQISALKNAYIETVKGYNIEAIRNFLNNNLTSTGDSEKYLEQMGTDKLAQYLDKNYGKILTPKEEIELGKLLNVSVKGSKPTDKEEKSILHALKVAGFSKGGLVSNINKIVSDSDDDVLCIARNDEAILSPEQTRAFIQMSSYMKPMTDIMKNMNNIPTVDRNISTNIQNDININIQGSNITDMNSFMHELKTNSQLQKGIQAITIDQLDKGSNRLFVNRF